MKYVIGLVSAITLFYFSIAAASTAQYTILVIPKDDSIHYWQWVKQGAFKAGQDRKVRIIYRGPRTADDYDAQIKIIEAGIQNNVDAIVLAPNHMTKATDILEKAIRKGIKVVIIDSDMKLAGRTSFVASDNYASGTIAAKYLLSIAGNKQTILLIRHLQDNNSTQERELGFIDAMTTLSPESTVIDSGYNSTTAGDVYHKVYSILRSDPKIGAIFTSAEVNTTSCLKAIEDLKLAGHIKLVGFDYTNEIHKALEEKAIHGIILQRPYKMGYLGVMAACDALEGHPVHPRIVTETVIVSDTKNILKYISTLEE